MRTLLSFKKTLLPVASAMGVVMLVAAMLPAPAAAAVTTSTPLLASVTCIGSLQNSGDKTDMPDASFAALGAFYQQEVNKQCTGAATPYPCCTTSGKGKCNDVAPFGQKSAGNGTLSLDLGFYFNASCTALSANGQPGTASGTPCSQGTFGFGTYTVYPGKYINTTLPPASMSVTFIDHSPAVAMGPPGPPASDPLRGCTATFEVYPDAAGGKSATASIMSLTGLSCTGAPMAGSQMTMECEAH